MFHLEFADPTEMAALLTSLFSDSGTTGSNSQTPVQFGGRGGGQPTLAQGGLPDAARLQEALDTAFASLSGS